jgi:uncharacterized protein YkwD
MFLKRIIYITFCLAVSLEGFSQNTDDCLTDEEMKLYMEINSYRKSKKLAPILVSAKLTKVAQTHVRDLERYYVFDAKNSCNPHSWSDKGDWTSCCYTNDHKQANCMWDKPKEISGYKGNGFEIAFYHSVQATAIEALNGWKQSKAHNELLVNTGIWQQVQWNAIGIGIYGKYAAVWFGELEDEIKPESCKD